MSWRDADAALDVEALLEQGKAIPRGPSDARARVLARARATVAAPPLYRLEPPREARMPMRFAAYALAVVAGVAGAAVALNGALSRTAERSPAADVTGRSSIPTAPAPLVPPVTPVPVAPETAPSASSTARPSHARRSDEAELELLRAAHSAYKAHNFANALVLVGEHARRFPSGLLAEQREALRVRSLAGAGRTDDARRAAAAFATHFPRSVLVPKLRDLGLLGE
jgi:hypothetical protein